MPNMAGLVFFEELKGIRPDIPIILRTGFSESITEENAKEMGILVSSSKLTRGTIIPYTQTSNLRPPSLGLTLFHKVAAFSGKEGLYIGGLQYGRNHRSL